MRRGGQRRRRGRGGGRGGGGGAFFNINGKNVHILSVCSLSLSLSQTRASLAFVKLSELKFHPFCLQLLVHLRRRRRRRRGTGRRRGRRMILYYMNGKTQFGKSGLWALHTICHIWSLNFILFSQLLVRLGRRRRRQRGGGGGREGGGGGRGGRRREGGRRGEDAFFYNYYINFFVIIYTICTIAVVWKGKMGKRVKWVDYLDMNVNLTWCIYAAPPQWSRNLYSIIFKWTST